MQLGISSHGRERLDFPQEWYDRNRAKYSPREMADVKRLARKRQKALDEGGFQRTGLYQEGGEFAGVENIYLGGDVFTPGDLSSAIELQGGDPATRHNLATLAQKEDFNTINQILGEADRLQDVDPHQASQIVADAEGYLADLEDQYEEAFGDVRQTAIEFERMRNRIRKDYRREKRQKTGRLVGSIVGGLIAPAVGTGIGGEIGSELAR